MISRGQGRRKLVVGGIEDSTTKVLGTTGAGTTVGIELRFRCQEFGQGTQGHPARLLLKAEAEGALT